MKKIINGKMYNTETATEIDWWQNMGNSGNHAYFIETLYRKKTGEFFLHGRGNASSKYAKRQEDGLRSPGEMIVPISTEEAMIWVENYSYVDTYIELFGTVEE